MSTTPHPLAQLSALLDDDLGPADRRVIESHLAGCAACRSRLAELRVVSSLIASLPDPVPSRRLAARLGGGVPLWMAPLRTLATLASGVSVFLFMASAFLSNIGPLATGGAAALPAPAAGRADTTTLASAGAAGATAMPYGPMVNVASASPSRERSDAVKQAGPSPSGTQAFAVAPQPTPRPDAQAAAESAQRDQRTERAAPPQLGPSPWLWLALAVVTGAIAIALQRRLRSS